MTVTQYLQQLIEQEKRGFTATTFTLTKVTGDPQGLEQGEVWATQGNLTLVGDNFEGKTKLSPIIPAPLSTPEYEVTVSVNISSGWLTVANDDSGAGEFFADHVQLQYYNGVLYGTATHLGFSIPGRVLKTLPGPIFTLSVYQTAPILPS